MTAYLLPLLNLFAAWLFFMGFISKKPTHRPYYLSAGIAALTICAMLFFGGMS